MIIVNKKTREICSDADGCAACVQSTEESPCALAWAFNPLNFPATGESLATHELYDELPLLNQEAHALKQALHHLSRIETTAKSWWLRETVHIVAQGIRMILLMYGIDC